LFISASTVSELELKANFHIQNINKWLTANKLHLNIEKTCYSIFSPNKSFSSTISLEINNSVINRVNNCKYTGVIIDDQLKWSIHIESVEQKLKHVIGILYKICYKLPDWCLRNIYFAFVHPCILYGLEVYGNTYVSYLDKLTTLAAGYASQHIMRCLSQARINREGCVRKGMRCKMVGMAEVGAPISQDGVAVHPGCWCLCLCYLHSATIKSRRWQTTI